MERFKTFTLLVSNINRSIRKIKNEEMAEFGLKSPHVSCLYYLYTEESLTAKELADICDEDKAALSRSIVALEKLGYIYCDAETSAGKFSFEFRNPHSNVRILEDKRVLISDIDGNCFVIRDPMKLDRASYKRIEPYL